MPVFPQSLESITSRLLLCAAGQLLSLEPPRGQEITKLNFSYILRKNLGMGEMKNEMIKTIYI